MWGGGSAPTGLWSDGKSIVYQRVIIAAGEHELFVGMNDSNRENGFDYEITRMLDIAPGRNIVVRFDELEQRFLIQ